MGNSVVNDINNGTYMYFKINLSPTKVFSTSYYTKICLFVAEYVPVNTFGCGTSPFQWPPLYIDFYPSKITWTFLITYDYITRMDGLTQPLFKDRLRPFKRLTSNHMSGFLVRGFTLVC